MITCQHCGKEYHKKGVKGHIWRKHGEGINFVSNRTGSSWSKGLTSATEPRLRKSDSSKYLKVVDKPVHGQRLRRLLVREELLRDCCSICFNEGRWHGKPITLELDHINGDRLDNRLENLRLLCPNCHSQTDTYKWRNTKTVKRYSVSIKTSMNY